MDYHLLYGISKYLCRLDINYLLGQCGYYYGLRNTYLYKRIPIEKKRCTFGELTREISDKYKYIVTCNSRHTNFEEIDEHCMYIYGIIIINNYIFEKLNSLPRRLRVLKIEGDHIRGESEFDEPVNELPKNLQILKIKSNSFEQPVDKLQKNLQILKIRSSVFDHLVNELLKNLQTLTIISGSFDQKVDVLPKNLQTLTVISG